MNLMDEIRNGETERLEFKEVPNDRADKWLKTVVAFANCRGGRILFGVSNSREVKGLDGDLFAIKDSISDAVASSCTPSVPIQVGITTVAGKPIVVLEVYEGVQTPYYIKSKGDVDGVYVRYDATTRIADEYALQDLRVEGSGRSYDSRVCRGLSATVDDIDALCKRMYELALVNAANDAERNLTRPVTKAQLVKWGILRDVGGELRPTNAFALLTDSERFSPVVKCGLFRGETRAVFIDRRQFVLPVQDQIEEAYKYVLSKINLGASFPNVHRKDTYEIPPGVIRELIANAVLHRTYVNAEASPITVAIYDNRLEITSPGKLKRGVTVEKMLQGCSDCRNEALALALSYMNIIEDWGSGIPRIRRMLAEAGLRDLVIEDWPNAVRVVVYRKENSAPPSDTGTGSDGKSSVCGGTKSRHQVAAPSRDENIYDEIVACCATPCSALELMAKVGRTDRTKFRKSVLTPLIASGLLEYTIPDKPNSRLQRYRLTEKGREAVEK